MKKLLICLVAGLCLCTVNLSCSKKSTSPNQVLTTERLAALEKAADSVFITVAAPGMMALISAEGEGDYIIKRGVSNIVTDDPMDVNQYFRIASNTKTFTGAAVLILADEGKISLDSSISYYLPEKHVPNGNRITIRNLGTMRSGLYDYAGDSLMWADFKNSGFTEYFPPDTLLAKAFRYGVKSDPGKFTDYCNTNIILLGLLLEKVTGKPVSQVIEEKVIGPMNLSETFWPESMYLFAPYLHGYTYYYGTCMDATNWNPSWGYSAGIMISTIPDMKIWAKADANGALLSDKMKTERFNFIDGYGFCLEKAGDWVGHPGTIRGYNSHVLYNTVKKIALIIVVNQDSEAPVEGFSAAFRRILEH
jgi:D-alanyl-D-alanine carboxypeptidase